MKFSETDNHAVELHEIYITIDISELYVEIIELYKESDNGPVFVLVTSAKATESSNDEQDINMDLRRLEL